MKQFPTLKGKNLEFKEYTIPYELEGELNIVIIPFQRWHQSLVDDWAQNLMILRIKYPKMKFYEIPSLSIGYKMMSFMIDGGMRAGIPSREVRERTITVYLNKSKFKEDLQIPNENTIYIFLLNKNGEILWRSKGDFNQEKGHQLEDELSNYFIRISN